MGNRAFRTLHIIMSVDRAGGGPVQALLQSVENGRVDRVVEVVSLDNPAAACVREFPGVIHAVGPAPARYGYTPYLSAWIAENGHRFDAAVIHGLWNHASVGGWQGCRRADLPYVIFTHGMMDPWFRKTYPLKHLAKQLFWFVQGRVLRDASEVLFTCEEEKRLADGAFLGYKYRPRVVAFGATDVLPPVDAENDALASVVPALGQRPFLLFLGRVHEKKGCDLLLEGFARASTRQELQLVIAGPSQGALAEQLCAQASALGIADRLHWAGMVKGATKAAAFRRAEAFVLTSHQENFGIAVAEALAYGTPVLISNQVNIWREIQAGGGGLVEPNTIAGARNLIDAWESMTVDARNRMKRSARAVYEFHFTIDAAERDLNAALMRAAASKLRAA